MLSKCCILFTNIFTCLASGGASSRTLARHGGRVELSRMRRSFWAEHMRSHNLYFFPILANTDSRQNPQRPAEISITLYLSASVWNHTHCFLNCKEFVCGKSATAIIINSIMCCMKAESWCNNSSQGRLDTNYFLSWKCISKDSVLDLWVCFGAICCLHNIDNYLTIFLC